MEYVLDEGRVAKMPDGCWLWLGSVGSHGYGDVWVGELHTLVHRLVAGAGPGEQVHHRCRQRLCVRREHLQVFGSAAEHTEEHTGGACVNGHSRTPENLRPRSRGSGFDCRPCQREASRRWRRARSA